MQYSAIATLHSINSSMRLLMTAMMLVPGLLQADAQRYNPWAYPGNGQVTTGQRPWANVPPGQGTQQKQRWSEPAPRYQYNPPAYPYHGYNGVPYTDPYYGYGQPYSPYSPYSLPGYGGTQGIYPGLHNSPIMPDMIYPYSGW